MQISCVIPGVKNSGRQKPCNWVCFQLCIRVSWLEELAHPLSFGKVQRITWKKNSRNLEMIRTKSLNWTFIVGYNYTISDHRLKEQVRIYKCTNDPSVLQGRFTFPLDFPQSIQFLFTSDTRHHSEFGRNLHCSFMCCTCHSTLSTDLCNTVLQASTPSSWGI